MEGSSSSSSGTKIGVEDWEAFCEYLRNLQPPRSLSDCTANDVVEFLRCLPFDRLEAVVVNLSANTFKTMFGSHMENPFCSQIVRTFLMEFAEEQTSQKEYGRKKLSLSPLSVSGEYKQNICTRHDDVPLRESLLSKVPDPTLQATSSETLQLREELKEVETPLQPDINPITVISCGHDQDPEETYFISYILNELGLHGFIPCRYDLTRSTVTESPVMARVCIMIISMMNNTRFRECLDKFSALMDHLEADKVALIPVYFKSSRDYSKSAQLGNSVQASQVQKWWEATIKCSVFNTYHYIKG